MKTDAKARILQLLKDAGSRGSLTWELINSTHCSAAARRVWDLQQEGHRIRKVKEGVGIYRWVYEGAPTPRPAPKKKLTQYTLLDLLREHHT
jgi:hypothetical protein